MQSTDKELMPAFFVSHSGPNLALSEDSYGDYLRNFSKTIKKPNAIVIFSAHYDEPVQTIGLVDKYPTIYDFSGFPREYYEMTYTPKGDQALAREISEIFKKQGINPFTAATKMVKNQFDKERGLDHGAWTVLKLMYPNEEIPVVSLSINPDLAPSEMYKIGTALQPLREKGVLIIASGALSHNFSKFKFSAGFDCKPEKWAKDLIEWVDKCLKEWKTEDLFDYRKTANGKVAAPTPEHFVPLFYAMGAGANKKKVTMLHDSYYAATGSYSLWRFD